MQMQMTATKKEEEATKIIAIPQELLYKLRMKYERAKVTDFGAVSSSIERTLDEHIEKHGTKPHPRQLYMMGDVLDFVAENIERQAEEREIKARTAAEWRKLEYGYVVRSTFSDMDMQDLIHPSEWHEFRECAHRFCINMWKPRRKNQLYCDDSCRKGEEYALRQFAKTSKEYANGTYLPIGAYKKIRDKQERENYMEHERLFTPAIVTKMAARKELSEIEGAQPRDRVTEERKNRAWQIEEATKRVEATKPSRMVTIKVGADYLAEKYGAEHVESERRRTEIMKGEMA